MAGRVENLKPWPKGVSGNAGGRPKTKPLTEELERLLEQEGPSGKTWVVAIAEALLKRASKGDVRAITELANRVEGKPFQAMELDVNAHVNLAERLDEARKRVGEGSNREMSTFVPFS